jgi:hypothetical protein
VGVVLEQNRQRASNVLQTQCLDVVSVDEDSSLCGVVYPSNQLEYCALPRSVRTNDDLGRRKDEMGLLRSYVWAYAKLAGIDFEGNVA